MTEKRSNHRKRIRYFRWTVKAAFLLLLVSPFVYLAGAPDHFVYSAFFGLNQPLLALPYGQSVCVVWTYAYSQIGPGAWLVCPLGGLQTLLTGQVAAFYILPLIVALLLFLSPIFLFGNLFCGWVCPVGTIIDSFDMAVSKWLPKIEAKRQQRLQRDKEKRRVKLDAASGGSSVNLLAACPSCPIGKVMGNKHVNLANGIVVTSLVGSAIFRFPVFCTFCPIGITTRGMFHLKAWTYITGTMMPIILELTIIPLAAVLVSIREKRYWCRKICPVGAVLNLAGSASPLIKPSINTEHCIAKGCTKSHTSNLSNQQEKPRSVNCSRCENACPQGINIVDQESLFRCTKCLECYVACERKAITIKPVGTPEAAIWLKRIFKRRPKQQRQAV